MSMHHSKEEFKRRALRLSYASEPGDKLSDMGDGKVLIRNPNKPDRVLDRSTGELTELPFNEWRNMGRDVLRAIILFLALAAPLLGYYLLR